MATVKQRAAQVFMEAWDANVETWQGEDALEYTTHCMQSVSDAGLLARELPSRDELTKLITRTIVAETSHYDGEGPAIADAVLALLGGE
ncbi:MAG TPA: hypothetical protein VK059_14890 [Nocardioidaceae bacterium]|nr:hypothetical protein [Nocardioidaceae bacterium]